MFSRIPLIFLLSTSLLFVLSEGSRGSKYQGRRKSEPAVLSGGPRGSTSSGIRKSAPPVQGTIPWTSRKCHGENVDKIQAHKWTSSNVTLKLYNTQYKSGTKLKCSSPPPGFDPKKKTKVVMHGFNSNGDFMANDYNFVTAYKRSDVNLIIVDWSSMAIWSGISTCATNFFSCGASGASGYVEAASCAIEVGKYLAGCLNDLKVDADDLHLFGHSLGAHGVGMTGRVMKKKPKRVTGMDPAGPGFSVKSELPITIERISKKLIPRIGQQSGQFVDIIHTNGLKLGYLDPLGHADYYVNGGKTQAKCSQVPVYSAQQSHGYAVRVVVASLRGTQTQKFWTCSIPQTCFDWNESRTELTFQVYQEEKNGIDGTYYLHTPSTDC